jgi:2-polyprenyl-3-methyl-5-hydroxy-6-metoxy-1,4-benzoquinol methylase
MAKTQIKAANILNLLQKRIQQRNVDAIFGENLVNPNSIEQQLTNLQSNYNISEKLYPVVSKKSGYTAKLSNRLIMKIYWIVKNLMNGVLEAQQRFNKATIESIKILNNEINGSKINDNNISDRYNYIDYHKFEDENRGDEQSIFQKQKMYLKYFEGRENILDVGCGRGEFLELLAQNRISAKGLELSEDYVNYCKSKGLDVEYGDAISYLKEIPDNSLGGLIALQVVEHLNPAYLLQFVKLTHDKLMPNSYIILETINPQSLIVFTSSYFKDLSHEQAIHPATLQFIAKSAGFVDCVIEYSGVVNEKDKLVIEGEDSAMNSNFEKLNSVLFGPQDYAVVGRKN